MRPRSIKIVVKINPERTGFGIDVVGADGLASGMTSSSLEPNTFEMSEHISTEVKLAVVRELMK